jgi:addiction module RelB/DinJ family antitoxin
MAQTSIMQISIDSQLKDDAESLLKTYQIQPSDLITKFLEYTVQQQDIPLEFLALSESDKQAMWETEQIIRNPEAFKSFSSFAEIMAEAQDELADEG